MPFLAPRVDCNMIHPSIQGEAGKDQSKRAFCVICFLWIMLVNLVYMKGRVLYSQMGKTRQDMSEQKEQRVEGDVTTRGSMGRTLCGEPGVHDGQGAV